jgi:uncharacterized membrane protein
VVSTAVQEFIGHELTRRGPLSPALLRHEEERANNLQSRIADVITGFAGSMTFVYVHMAWFAFWILLPVEKYPFGLLTMIVSLEAIFLSTFVMISQNREAQRSEIRAQLDFETNVLGEIWIEMIAARLGIDVGEVHAKVAERMAAAKARQDAAESGGAALTGDPTLDTQYVHTGVTAQPQQGPLPT